MKNNIISFPKKSKNLSTEEQITIAMIESNTAQFLLAAEMQRDGMNVEAILESVQAQRIRLTNHARKHNQRAALEALFFADEAKQEAK